MAEPREICQLNSLALFWRKNRKSLLNKPVPFGHHTRLFWIEGSGRDGRHHFRGFFFLALLRLSTEAINGLTSGEREKPCRWRAPLRVVGRCSAPHLSVNVNRDLFSRCRVAQDAQGKSIDKVTGSIIKCAKRSLVPPGLPGG